MTTCTQFGTLRYQNLGRAEDIEADVLVDDAMKTEITTGIRRGGEGERRNGVGHDGTEVKRTEAASVVGGSSQNIGNSVLDVKVGEKILAAATSDSSCEITDEVTRTLAVATITEQKLKDDNHFRCKVINQLVKHGLGFPAIAHWISFENQCFSKDIEEPHHACTLLSMLVKEKKLLKVRVRNV